MTKILVAINKILVIPIRILVRVYLTLIPVKVTIILDRLTKLLVIPTRILARVHLTL